MEYKLEHINHKTIKYYCVFKGKVISFSEWIRHMIRSEEFAWEFIKILQESRYEAYFLEFKPINLATIKDPFEFVLIDSDQLKSIAQDESSFSKYFREDEAAVSFPNLRKDAQLIVPVNTSEQTDYVHLSNFVRTGKRKQLLYFWQKVATVYKESIGSEKKWLSTSGLGVHWLHVRIDTKSKYYQYKEYKYG